MSVEPRSPRDELLLVLADDELVTGHRASHWTGVAPSMEEDLAFATIAQDAVNHADLWYQVLLGPELTGEAQRDAVDRLGLGRDPQGYRHAIVCERPPRDFAYTLARHWAYDHAAALRLEALSDSTDGEVAALAAKVRHEERYHLDHADHWFRRLTREAPSGRLTREAPSGRLTRGGEGRERFRQALAAVLPEALGLFEPPLGEDEVVAEGLLPVPHAELRARWSEHVEAALRAVDLADLVPTQLPDEAAGGRTGRHTDDFTVDVWPEMTALHRAHPGARW